MRTTLGSPLGDQGRRPPYGRPFCKFAEPVPPPYEPPSRQANDSLPRRDGYSAPACRELGREIIVSGPTDFKTEVNTNIPRSCRRLASAGSPPRGGTTSLRAGVGDRKRSDVRSDSDRTSEEGFKQASRTCKTDDPRESVVLGRLMASQGCPSLLQKLKAFKKMTVADEAITSPPHPYFERP